MIPGGFLRRWASAAIAAVVLCALVPAGAGAKERSVRTDADYFGVNYPLLPFDSPEVRDRQLDAIHAAGIGSVRAALSWANLEPSAPSGNHHTYDWTASDAQIAVLASHRLRLMPALMYTPSWAAIPSFDCGAGRSVTSGTTKIGDYAAAAAAAAQRYGTGGSFWRAHPELPETPITTWQIWNEPNLTSYWCPKPNPGTYAELFAQAAIAIKSVQRDARVITSGLVLADRPGRFVNVGEFLGSMTAARPDIWRIADGVGAHLFPSGTLDEQFLLVGHTRKLMNAAGVPKSEPMYASEVGWGLAEFGLSEAERAERYEFFTERAPSTNCNIGMMYAHAWTTSPPGGPVYDFDSGIANNVTAALFPSAVAYRDTIAVLEGRGEREAIHPNLQTCDAMPKLDRDRDGRAEHRDYYPLDPSRWKGPPEWYGELVVTAKARQRLGKPVTVEATCEDECLLRATGSLKLAKTKQKVALKSKSVAADVGETRALALKVGNKARKQIKRSRARSGRLTVTVTASFGPGDDVKGETVVKLRKSKR